MDTNDSLINEWKREEKTSFSGWDFSYIKGRINYEEPPWDYVSLAKQLIKKSSSLLDMGTGGGEFLSTLRPFPEHTVATEGYKPNVGVARKLLEPLGVKVVKVDESGKLPFGDGEFNLILNKHSAFDAEELFRTLRLGGTFLTQQVDGNDLKDLASAFERERMYSYWSSDLAVQRLESAGLTIIEQKDWTGMTRFADVGAIVYFLKAIPWIVKDFSVERDLKHLKELQERLESGKPLEFKKARFLIKAEK